MGQKNEKINVGGQAVIEGVMMRSPHAISVAVRKLSGDIVVKKEPFVSWTKRHKILNLPIFRGGVALIESIILGIRALSFSGDIAIEEENKKEKAEKNKEKNIEETIEETEDEFIPSKMSGWRLGLLVLFSFGIGLLLFFYLPLVLTDLLGVKSGFWFNVVDGAFRLLVFLLYLGLITLIKDIRRIFQYHGAEHKSIFAFENKLDLTIPNAQSFTTFHPRCGTSFLLIVMVVSIFVFLFLGRPDSIPDRLIRLLFVPVIGGISYEFIRLSGKFSDNKIASIFIAPGLWLQRITTKEPDDSQVEVAIAALQSSLTHDFSKPIEIIRADK
jgi:uncharacterized protein YqhQ